VVVLSHQFWMRRFAGTPNVLSQRLILNGEPYEIIGVMPPDFTHRNADLFVPLARKLDPATRGSHFMRVYARMKPGMTVERAAREMRAVGQRLAKEFGHNRVAGQLMPGLKTRPTCVGRTFRSAVLSRSHFSAE
jgi:putative ABC transport system permease protein